MDHSVRIYNNNGIGNHQNHNQTCTKHRPATRRQRETSPITREFDPSGSINIIEITSSNDTFQATPRPSTILKYKTYQTK